MTRVLRALRERCDRADLRAQAWLVSKLGEWEKTADAIGAAIGLGLVVVWCAL